jgi:hypothetical protein
MDEEYIRPLSMVGAGETVKVVKVNAGRGLNSRLAAMGLVANTEITTSWSTRITHRLKCTFSASLYWRNSLE